MFSYTGIPILYNLLITVHCNTLVVNNLLTTNVLECTVINKLYNMGIPVFMRATWVGRESSHGTKELFNLPPLVLKARHPMMGLPFALDYLGWKFLSRHWVGYP